MADTTSDYLAQNQRRWDELVSIHVASRFYDVEGFRSGECALLPIEVAELGDVEGRSLCHLQCHFGLDTLSWARRGAKVTGVDFSAKAIEAATALAVDAGIAARFVTTEVTAAPKALDGETFDIVFTSWGVLGWLPDLDAWARAAAALLKPGGVFYIVETHPVLYLFDGSGKDKLELNYAYFRNEAPLVEDAGSYADPNAKVQQRRHYAWIFELGNVVTALVRAGLVIEFLHEHDGTCNATVPQMRQSPDRLWRLPVEAIALPCSFSIRASKPAD